MSKLTKKEKILSHNSAGQHVISGLSKPTYADIALYLISGILFISLINYRNIWNAVNNTVQTKAIDTNAIIDDKLVGVGDKINVLLGGRVGQMIFWAIVGCLIYMLIWLVQNTVINLRNDVVADQYLHPKSYKRISYWEGVIAHKIFFVSLLVCLVIFIYLSYSLIIPILSQVFYIATFSFVFPGSVLQLILVSILSGLLIYLFIQLCKLVLYSYQAIVNNF